MEVIANGIQFPYQTVILKRWCFLWSMTIQQETQIGFLGKSAFLCMVFKSLLFFCS